MSGTGYTGPIGINLLNNPGFELGLSGWTTDEGAIRSGDDPVPHGGDFYLMGGIDTGTDRDSYTYQTIDLIAVGFTVGEIDSGSGTVSFGGWQSGWRWQTDSGMIEVMTTGIAGGLHKAL